MKAHVAESCVPPGVAGVRWVGILYVSGMLGVRAMSLGLGSMSARA